MLRPLYWSALLPLMLAGLLITRKKPRLTRGWLMLLSIAFLMGAQPALWYGTLIFAFLAWALPRRGGRKGALGYAALSLGVLALLKLLRVDWPTGLSFVLLQGIAYGLDTTSGKAAPGTLTETVTYLTFFPKLSAGPLARFDAFRNELWQASLRWETIEAGLMLAIGGLGRKLLIADRLRPLALAVFTDHPHPLAGALSLGTCALYVYHDFMGATDMARGVALMAGIELPENFNRPFSALSLRDFWRRWHMSLSGFMRDYLYIPLGGSRRGKRRTVMNLFLVFAAMGLWHGFTWPFLIFGLWHGFFMALEHTGALKPAAWPRALSRLYTLAVVFFGFVIFMAPDAASLVRDFSPSLAAWQDVRMLFSPLSVAVLALGVALPCLPEVRCPAWLRRVSALILLVVCYAHLLAAGFAPLLYAQF